MDDLFERIKSQVSILDYIRMVTGSEAIRVGENTYRTNPCPLCGANDACTLYPKTQSFNCFSCEAAGDVVNLEKLLRNHSDNPSAAKAVAAKMGITLDAATEKVKKKDPQKSDKSKPEAQAKPTVEPEKLVSLRKEVAEFFHQCLLDTPKALEYQTKQRGHSLNLLKRFKIGFVSRKSILTYIKQSKKYTLEDLCNIGIARERGKSIVPVIPQGLYVYPHLVGGDVGFFTIKDPSKEQSFQIKKQYALEGWLCFNQSALNSDEVILVEGEDDALTIFDKGSRRNVAAIIGNFNSPAILSHLKANSKGKTFFLSFDPDSAGEKYVKRYSAAILKGSGCVNVIRVPEGFSDIDESLRAGSNPEAAFRALIEEAETISQDGVGSGDDRFLRDLVPSFRSFDFIGEDSENRLVLFSKINRKLYFFKPRYFMLDQLVQVGGIEVFLRVSSDAEDSKRIYFRTLKKLIIMAAGKKQLGKLKHIGQGVSMTDAGKALILNGAEAVLWDGKAFTNHNHPLLERKVLVRSSGDRWIDFDKVRKCCLSMTTDSSKSVLERLYKIINQWGFLYQGDVLLICGWILALFVQQLWEWRPHLYICGARDSGKSKFMELVEALGGRLSLKREGNASEAGLRQELASNASFLLLDEFEYNQHKQSILEWARSANRGGVVSRGTVNQKAVQFSVKHMFMAASIDKGLRRAADRSRFLIVETAKDPTRSPKIPNTEIIEELRIALHAVALWAVFDAKKLIREIGRIERFEGREVENFAVPLSMITVISGGGAEELQEEVQSIMDEREKQIREDVIEDEEQLIRDISFASIRIAMDGDGIVGDQDKPPYRDVTISQLLQRGEIFNSYLETVGIKYCNDKAFLIPNVVSFKLLSKHELWNKLEIRDILKRIDGAESSQRTVAGKVQRGIMIPLSQFLESFEAV